MPFQIRIQNDRPGTAFTDEVLKALTPALNGSSPAVAAQAIDLICRNDYDETGDAAQWLENFWLTINETARQLPYNSKEQDRMAAVLKELQGLPPRIVVLEGEWSQLSPAKMWAELPMFEWTYSEGRNYDPSDPGTVQRWVRILNLECFATKVWGLCNLDATYSLVFALAIVLEGSMKRTTINGPEVLDKDPASNPHVEYEAKIAASWMIHAGHQLYGRDEDIQNCRVGPLWEMRVKEEHRQGRKVRLNGICKQRWEMWRARFGAVSRSESIDSATRQYAKRAQEAMKNIQKNIGDWDQ